MSKEAEFIWSLVGGQSQRPFLGDSLYLESSLDGFSAF